MPRPFRSSSDSLPPGYNCPVSYLDTIRRLPCACCGAAPPSYAHHIRHGQGIGRKASDFLAVPLCHECHQGPHGVHGDRARLRARKLDELDLLADTISRLQVRAKPVAQPGLEAMLISSGLDWVKLRIHPDHGNPFLLDWPAQRYSLTITRIEHDETAVQAAIDAPNNAEYSEGMKALRIASGCATGTSACGVLSGSAVFAHFALEQGYTDPAAYIRAYCGVASRGEVRTGTPAMRKLTELMLAFRSWLSEKKKPGIEAGHEAMT